MLDRDASGSINSASELFGNELVDGYTKLRELDTNQDGVINSADEQFAQLQIWRDLNGNGTSEAGELVSLSSLGIVTIGLERTPHGRPIAGNEVAFTGSFARGDGSVGATGAVFFQADRTLTRWNPPEGFVLDPDTAVLPLLKGYGTLPDLNYAMTLDSNLKQMVQEFTLGVGSMDRAQMSSAFMALMYRWAGVEGVAPGSRGPNVDAVHLAFLDKFFGSPIVRPASNGSPGIPNARFGQEIESSFAEVFGALLVRFLSSVPISMLQLGADWDNLLDLPFLSLRHLKYEAGSDGFQGQAKFVIFEALHNIPAQPQAAIDYIDEVIFILSGLTLEFYSGDRARFVEDVRLNLLDLTDKGLATLAVDLASNGSALTKGTVAGEAIVGTTKADIIIGFQGNDTLTGGGGADTYVYARGDGHDVIIDAASFNNEVDKLVLAGVDPSAVTLQRNGNDLTLVIAESAPGAGDGGSILIKATLDDYYSSGLEQIVLADGTVWTKADLRLMLLAQASTAGDDTIAGFDVADVITAGAGNDTVNAGAGNDRITGGLGNDTLTGGGGADTYVYARGDGHDVIIDAASYNNEVDKLVLTGVDPGAVTLQRNGNDLTLVIAESEPGAGDGGSILIKATLDDYYSSGLEQIVLADGTVWTKADLRLMLLAQASTAGDDTIAGFDVADVITAGAGNDTVNAGAGNDSITGGLGNDTLTGGGGADTYVYARGDGHDVIIDAASYNNEVDKLVLTGVDPGAVTLQRNGNDLTLVIAESEPGAGDGGSILIKATLDDYYSSGLEQIVLADGTVWTKADLRLMLLAQASTAGDDTIAGFDVADVITAGAGNDTVNAGAGNDSITGGLGNDTLTGGGGADTYVYARGDGHDVIVETGFLEGVADTLVLTGVASTAVTVERFGSDVTLVIAESAPGAGDGGRIKLKEQYQSLYDRGVETVTFSDGVSWTKADIANIIAEQIGSSGVTHPGTTGDDTISGTSGNDTFDGYGGNDTLTGGVGSDTYRFGVGSGNDLIIETSSAADTDRIELLGLNPDDVVLSRSGNHLFVVIKATGETLKVQDHFYVASYGIDQIVFANGTTLDRAAIQQAAWIRGDGGDNALTGSAANDTLDGGAGNDTLTGGTGSDTYRFGVGSGNDVIIETSSAADTDRINLLGLNPDDVVLNRSGNHLFVTIKATGETLKVQDHFYTTSYGIDQIVFANGTTLDRVAIQQAAWIRGDGGDNSLTGSAANDTLDGGAGNDTLNGGTGSDTYRFGAGSGNDVVIETSSAADTDRIELLGLNPDDVVLSRSGNHLFVVIKATGETLKVQDHFYTTSYGIDQIVFANGTSLDRAAIQQAAWIRGDAGDNTLTGTSGNDVFEGGGGNDRFNSGAGNDTYIYRSGDGSDVINEESGSTTEVDVLKFANLNASDLTLARAGQHLVVTVNSTGQTITVDEHFYSQTANWGVERFEFADGTSWNLSEINSRAWFKGTVGNDTLSGSSWNDTFHGGMGDDRFNSAVGSDTFLYASGDGNDVINEESGSTSEIDVLKFTDLNASDLTLARLGQHLVVTVNSTGQTITIDEHFYSQTANYGVERFEFADGTGWNFAEINARAWYRGTAGNDTISGSAWNDTLSGGAGNDTFSGGAGSDVFVFAPGFGKDTITDFVAGSATADLIEFDDAVFADLNAVLAAATQVGADTVITFDADNTITLKNVTKTNLHADDFRFV
ncbi:hypothetical protein B5U98_31030 [Bosea sp. Tri-39]|nr:hypothetical protein B5U98_31030 [Bosea sp. Tri-39]